MSELIFLVEEAPEGGFIARALARPFSPRLMTCRVCGSRFATLCAAILRKGRDRR